MQAFTNRRQFTSIEEQASINGARQRGRGCNRETETKGDGLEVIKDGGVLPRVAWAWGHWGRWGTVGPQLRRWHAPGWGRGRWWALRAGSRTEECSRIEGYGDHVWGDPRAVTMADGCLEIFLSVGKERAEHEILGHMHQIGDANL
jgi:hypothetical protein